MRLSFFILAILMGFCQSARILGIFPTASFSHQITFHGVMRGLAKKGHDVVMMTTDPLEPMENLRQIDVKEVSYPPFKALLNSMQNKWRSSQIMGLFLDYMIPVIEIQLSQPEMQPIIRGEAGPFDVCFFESIHHMPFAIKDIYNCSLITLVSLSAFESDHLIAGNPLHPSIYNDPLRSQYNNNTFWNRLNNWYYSLYNRLELYYVLYPKIQTTMERILRRKIRPMGEITADVDMIFINSYRIFGDLRPVSANTVYLGGLHLKRPKPLRKDIKAIMDAATNGVIYFSFGTNVNTTLVPEDLYFKFLNVFRRLPYTIVWKYDTDHMPGQPKNVHIFKWLPQQDVLAHPNVKVFITQGGQQSTEEAIDRQVPLLVIPFLGDQPVNAKKVEHYGIGLKMELHEEITEKRIETCIVDLATNKKYRENIKRFKDIVYDEPLNSVDRAVFWTEYVIRHRGAKHLQTESLKKPFYINYCLDIIAFLLICSILGVSVLLVIYKYVSNFFNLRKKLKDD